MELPERILQWLDQKSTAESLNLASQFKEDHQKIVGAIKSLECLGNLIQATSYTIKKWQLTEEGEAVAKSGSHEAKVFEAVPQQGIAQPDLMKATGASGKVGFSKAMSNGWLHVDKSGGKPLVKRKVDSITDVVKENLDLVVKGKPDQLDGNIRDDYKKRKLLHEVIVTAYKLEKGSQFTTVIEKASTELTPDMLASGSWKTSTFKPYNFDALGLAPPAGHLHPLLKVRAEYRQIFLEMGFSEMPTNNFVESSFWNFDALFQPQQHPARDAHDTFFVSDPANATDFPPDYLEVVKSVHSKGGFGSKGYGYDWKIEEARKNILRTHTTAVSARMLYKLAQESVDGSFKPQKYFSIDRVFRNETLDATHLAEFHQIEGLVADYDLTLGDLIGVIYEFFKKLGIEKLRFKPAYNPYTEPSMEIFSYHEGLQKWVEIGNSGIFRPEMLLPMGLPEDVNVIAWGLSLERPTMIKYGIDNIRDLVGHKVNLKMVQDNPICRLDKDTRNPLATLATVTEKRWINIESKLNYLAKQVNQLRSERGLAQNNFNTTINVTSQNVAQNAFKDIVIYADPNHVPHSIQWVVGMLIQQHQNIFLSTHVHSSVPSSSSSSSLSTDFLDVLSKNQHMSRMECDFAITLIWKSVGIDPILLVSPTQNAIRGEVNIARFLARLAEDLNLKTLPYESLRNDQVVLLDQLLDNIHCLIHAERKEELARNLCSTLKKQDWLLNDDQMTIADLVMASLHTRKVFVDNNKSWQKRKLSILKASSSA